MATELEELAKAIELGTQAAATLTKSQPSLFGEGTTNMSRKEIIGARREGILNKDEARQMHGEAHHVGYTRTNASGTSSTVQAKGDSPPAPSLLQKYSRFEDADLKQVTDRSGNAKKELAAAGYEPYEPKEKQKYQVKGSSGTHYTRHADSGASTTSTYHKKGDHIVENKVVVRNRTHIHQMAEYNN